jgi:hypothetical protein
MPALLLSAAATGQNRRRVVTRRRDCRQEFSRLHGRVRGSGIVAGPTSQITLKRLRRPLGDVLRTYKVVIDGNTVGDIRRGETKTCDLPPASAEVAGRPQYRLATSSMYARRMRAPSADPGSAVLSIAIAAGITRLSHCTTTTRR